MSWTDEKVKKLKELWTKGHTASQIAEALGDTTRNAVIGKAHRLNLEARAPSKHSGVSVSRENKQIRRGPAQTSRKAKFQSILLDKNFEPENPKSLEELTDTTCKWPYVGWAQAAAASDAGERGRGRTWLVGHVLA